MQSLYQRAYNQFDRDLDGLLDDAGKCGQWVLYRGELQVALSESRDELYEVIARWGWTGDESFIGQIAPRQDEVEPEIFRYR